MPYNLKCDKSGRMCRVHKKGTRKYYSKRKLPRAMAVRQMRAMYAASKR